MRDRTRAQTGQAMTEFVIAIVAFIVVIAGLLQMGSLCRAKVQTMINSRGWAGYLAINHDYTPLPVRFISTWTDGPDMVTYTEDDQFVGGDAGNFMAVAMRASNRPVNYPNYTAPYVQRNALAQFIAAHGGDYSNSIGWAIGYDYRDVPIDPVVQRLVMARRYLTVSGTTVMPSFNTEGFP